MTELYVTGRARSADYDAAFGGDKDFRAGAAYATEERAVAALIARKGWGS
jgi:hypothetical protein